MATPTLGPSLKTIGLINRRADGCMTISKMFWKRVTGKDSIMLGISLARCSVPRLESSTLIIMMLRNSTRRVSASYTLFLPLINLVQWVEALGKIYSKLSNK